MACCIVIFRNACFFCTSVCFEAVVAVLPVVICFQSMVLDMAGNVGTQSLAVTIRVLMDETLSAKKKLSLLSKR